jgi:hypothetical protein
VRELSSRSVRRDRDFGHGTDMASGCRAEARRSGVANQWRRPTFPLVSARGEWVNCPPDEITWLDRRMLSGDEDLTLHRAPRARASLRPPPLGTVQPRHDLPDLPGPGRSPDTADRGGRGADGTARPPGRPDPL